MSWYWVVVVQRGDTQYEVRSPVGYSYRQYAQLNLEARINRDVPNLPGWQQGDHIVSASLELR